MEDLVKVHICMYIPGLQTEREHAIEAWKLVNQDMISRVGAAAACQSREEAQDHEDQAHLRLHAQLHTCNNTIQSIYISRSCSCIYIYIYVEIGSCIASDQQIESKLKRHVIMNRQ